MTEKAPVADFSQVLEEFNQAVASREIAQRGEYTFEIQARNKWKELSALRERMLDTLLAERGLALCSQASSHLRPELYLKVHVVKDGQHTIDQTEVAKLDQQDLGVFPKDQMRLHLRRFTARAHQGHPSLERLEQFEEFELLCPKHFPKPKDTNKSWGSNAEERYKRGNDMESEVIEKNGRLITKVGDVDVTDFPVERVIDEAIYQYFKLPQLHPEPKL